MAQLPTNQNITYQLQFRKCGKPSCGACKRGPGHGPYWYAYWREGNKLRSGYIGKVRPSDVSPAVVARAEARLDQRRAQIQQSAAHAPVAAAARGPRGPQPPADKRRDPRQQLAGIS